MKHLFLLLAIALSANGQSIWRNARLANMTVVQTAAGFSGWTNNFELAVATGTNTTIASSSVSSDINLPEGNVSKVRVYLASVSFDVYTLKLGLFRTNDNACLGWGQTNLSAGFSGWQAVSFSTTNLSGGTYRVGIGAQTGSGNIGVPTDGGKWQIYNEEYGTFPALNNPWLNDAPGLLVGVYFE